MTEDGKVRCGLCKGEKFIGEFYTAKVEFGISSFKDIWWGDPETGKQYGRPNSYCKKCNLVSQKGPHAVARLKDLVRFQQAAYVYDVNEAWLQALDEEAVRYPVETELMRLVRKAMES